MITKITDHENRMLGLLVTQFKDKPNLENILKAFAAEVQEIENVSYDLYRAFDPSTATGDQLDLLGRLVGEERQARSDTDYRQAIQVRIGINISHGEPEKIITILTNLTDSTSIQIVEIFPAGLYIFFNGTADFTTIRDLVALMVSAGVQFTLASSNGESPFVFDGDPDGGGFSAAGYLTEGSLSGVL